METIITGYQPIDRQFYNLLQTTVAERKKAIIQHFNEFRELHRAAGLVKTLVAENGEEFLEMATGERIRLDRIITLDGRFFPGYEGYQEALGARCSL